MRNYKISRRNFLAVAGTLTAAAALTACGGSASSTVATSTAISWPRALRQRLVSR